MPPQVFPLDKGGIISTVLEGILYGFSVFMYGITLWILVGQHTTKAVNRPMVVVATLLFIFSTVHIGVDIRRLIEGLVNNRDFPNGGPPLWFEDVSQYTFVVKSGLYSLQTLTGDGVVIYRCYIVWKSVWIVVFPIIMWFGLAVSAVGSVYSCSQTTLANGGIFQGNTYQWVTAYFSGTLATNSISTALLMLKIYQINSQVARRSSQNSLMPVLVIVADSGALYTAGLLSALICFVIKSNGQFVVLDMIMPLISIVFYMIIVRVGLRQLQASPFDSNGGLTIPGQRQGYPMRPLEVHITRFNEQRGDSDMAVSAEIDGQLDASSRKERDSDVV